MLRLSVILGMTLAHPSIARGDNYSDAMSRAKALAAKGEVGRAATELDRVIPEYPQDYAIALEAGWLHYRAGEYGAAERDYHIARSRSPQAMDARVGLGWSLAQQGRCTEAEREFQAILSVSPEHAEATLGVNRCKELNPSTSVVGSVAWTELRFPSHAIKEAGHGITLSLDSAIAGRWVLGGTFRYTTFTTVEGSGVAGFHQNEGYVRLGYTSPKTDLIFTGAVVVDSSQTTGTSRHVGLWARQSLTSHFDLRVSGSASLYRDQTRLRLEGASRVGLGGPVSLIPFLAVQNGSSNALYSGGATLLVEGNKLGAWFGGKYGDEDKPAYLERSVVYNNSEKIRWGLWAGAKVLPAPWLSVWAGYSLDRLETTSGDTSNMHAVTMGLSGTF